jgi:hypothetical protein
MRITRSLLLIVAAGFLCAFIWGGKNYFMNGSKGPILIRYDSTSGHHSGDVIRFGGLKDSTDNGDLLSIYVQYSSGRVITLDRSQVQRLRASVRDDHGVWWIGDSHIEYLSGRDANLRMKHLQRSFREQQRKSSNQPIQRTAGRAAF